jgi:hypothetical protein
MLFLKLLYGSVAAEFIERYRRNYREEAATRRDGDKRNVCSLSLHPPPLRGESEVSTKVERRRAKTMEEAEAVNASS